MSAVVAGLLLAVAVAWAAPVHAAAPYPPPSPSIAVSATTARAGGTLLLNFCGFEPHESVSMALTSVTTHLGTVTAGADGCGSVRVTIPVGVSGLQEIALTGAASGRVAVVKIKIEATGPGGTAAPSRGAAARSFGLGAGAVIVAILVFLGAFYTRRRRAG
jgi:hypothetical protein